MLFIGPRAAPGSIVIGFSITSGPLDVLANHARKKDWRKYANPTLLYYPIRQLASLILIYPVKVYELPASPANDTGASPGPSRRHVPDTVQVTITSVTCPSAHEKSSV